MSVLESIRYDSDESIMDMVDEIVDKYLESGKKEFVIVNIGTDKCIGDCLGPMVGSFLKEQWSSANNVEGTVEYPIHALNIMTSMETIRFKYDNPFIVGVDACIGEPESIGNIMLRDTSLRPGKGVGKKLCEVGDISIVGVVADESTSAYFTQLQIRLHFIMKMASKIATILDKAVCEIEETIKYE